MKPKYKMTREDNVFYAKRNIVDLIYGSAKLEGLGVTFPQTQTIFDGFSVAGVPVNDIIAVNNLKNAWLFLFQNIDYPMDYVYFCKLHQLLGADNLIVNPGYIRKAAVTIGGTKWAPEIPSEKEVKGELAGILSIKSATDRAITLMLYGMRRQVFLDGNKRVSMLAANQIMISAGEGVISVPVELQEEFYKLLLAYYETGKETAIKEFIYDNCIGGAVYGKAENKPIDFPGKK